jgi:hypothetical protein
MQDVKPVSTETINIAEESQGWSQLGKHIFVKIIIVAALLMWIFNVEIKSTVNKWITDSSWSHGFLIPLFSLYFLNQRKKEILNLEFRHNYLGAVFLICCVIFYWLVLVVYKFGYLRLAVIIPTIGSTVLLLGGWRLVKYTWLPIVYLFFALPLPDSIY